MTSFTHSINVQTFIFLQIWGEQGNALSDHLGTLPHGVTTLGLEVNEDTDLILKQITINDVDSGASGLLTVSITAKHGSTRMTSPLTVPLATSGTVTGVTPNYIRSTAKRRSSVINNINVPDAAATVQQFVGNGVDVNITLSTLIYTPLPHWHGIDTLNVTVTDDQNATTTELLLIRVLPINDLPEIVMPNYLPNTTNITGIVIHEDHTVFPYEGILLSDPDSADQPRGRLTESPLRVVIESRNGTIEVGVGHRGLIWIDSAATMHASNLSSSGHRRLEFHADASDLTEAVRSITFRPDPDFYGIARCGKYFKAKERHANGAL